jgi:hypothetical protein
MPEPCTHESKTICYSDSKLFSEKHSGLPGGAGRSLGCVEIAICKNCGIATFKVPDAELAIIRRWQSA